MTKQLLFIGGGTSFNSYESYLHDLKESPISYERLKPLVKWTDGLVDAFPEFDVLVPSFPNKQNAQYGEWKILFEKIVPYLKDEVALVGYSLGAMFLAKYLHENPLAVPVDVLVLIAPTYDDETNEELGSFKIESATGLERSAHKIHLFHSEDDPVSPFSELTKFQKDIPTAEVHIFTNRSHFFQPTFSELVEVITTSL